MAFLPRDSRDRLDHGVPTDALGVSHSLVLAAWNSIIVDKVSVLVREEIERGDPEAAASRLVALAGITVLTISNDARDLAKVLIENRLIPSQFPEDALHIAIAATHGMDYILTWNFKHLNNVQTKGKIADFIEGCGYEPPLVCSPDELFGELS